MKLSIFDILKKGNIDKRYICKGELYVVKENPSGVISLKHSNGASMLLNDKNINKHFIEAKE
ncbi:hypothetical protein [Clostridium brassicae]|uniref:Phage protein n=1 Tax=Clostridium brassicae TaxID=2999072 RepID=A0ABT4D9N0_9CLOT|nr:hypothetical protein [Clostridium brassicae]MCY6957936.1 hypothetical protein [Clostridium brassicae]